MITTLPRRANLVLIYCEKQKKNLKKLPWTKMTISLPGPSGGCPCPEPRLLREAERPSGLVQ